ncbi:MAG: DUF2207 domain-containing protein, partial [Chloroflexia bacterium]|nr:DUF2207 domain-containing protein [Chloroflexia bacterium]
MPVVITIVLFVLWFFIGRDKKQEIIEKYYIPDNISPPEVGFIWDGKLHKRDLIALIYHWAAKGYLKISGMNTDEKDLTLTKLKDLPQKEVK